MLKTSFETRTEQFFLALIDLNVKKEKVSLTQLCKSLQLPTIITSLMKKRGIFSVNSDKYVVFHVDVNNYKYYATKTIEDVREYNRSVQSKNQKKKAIQAIEKPVPSSLLLNKGFTTLNQNEAVYTIKVLLHLEKVSFKHAFNFQYGNTKVFNAESIGFKENGNDLIVTIFIEDEIISEVNVPKRKLYTLDKSIQDSVEEIYQHYPKTFIELKVLSND